jgi:hypothetical protein
VVLVDTPGIGGLNARHAEIALEGAAKASALLFVTDASAPLSEVELGFLARAAETVDTVLFALTKFGRFRGWADVLEENKANLAAVAPRFADALWVPTDARLALDAIDDLGGHPSANGCARQDADALADWAESGVGTLLGVLTEQIAPKAQLMASANVVRLCRSSLDRMARAVVEQQAALENDPHLVATVEAEEARLQGLRNENRTWGPTLERQLSTLRIDTSNELNQRMATCRSQWVARLRGLRRAPSEPEVQDLLDELQADVEDVATDVLALTKARFRNVAEGLFGDLVDETNVPVALDALASRVPLTIPQNMPPGKAFGAQDSMDLYYGFAMGQGAAGLLVGPAIGLAGALLGVSIPAAPVTAVLGVLAGFAGIGARLGVRKDTMRASDLNQTVLNWINEASGLIRGEIERNTVDAKYLLADAFRTTLDARIVEVEKVLGAAQLAARADKATIDDQRRALRSRATQIDKQVAQLDELLAAPVLQAIPGSPGDAFPTTALRRQEGLQC